MIPKELEPYLVRSTLDGMDLSLPLAHNRWVPYVPFLVPAVGAFFTLASLVEGTNACPLMLFTVLLGVWSGMFWARSTMDPHTVDLRVERGKLVRRWHPYRFAVGRRERNEYTVSTLDLRHVEATDDALMLVHHDGTTYNLRLPLEYPHLLKVLAKFVEATAAEDGTSAQIPESLRELRGQAKRGSAGGTRTGVAEQG